MNVLITGATKGIGRALVDRFAAEGAELALCARTAADVDQLRAELKAAYPSTRPIARAVDVTDRAALDGFATHVLGEWEHVDVLINNAGGYRPGTVLDEADGQLIELLELNLMSAYHLTRAVVPTMVKRGSGHVFNLCSTASHGPFAAGGSYGIAKYALYGFHQNLRDALKTTGVKVTAVSPGPTWSASWAGVELPESRLLQAADVAAMVWQATQLSPSAVVEDIVLRPQLGDL